MITTYRSIAFANMYDRRLNSSKKGTRVWKSERMSSFTHDNWFTSMIILYGSCYGIQNCVYLWIALLLFDWTFALYCLVPICADLSFKGHSQWKSKLHSQHFDSLVIHLYYSTFARNKKTLYLQNIRELPREVALPTHSLTFQSTISYVQTQQQ